MYSQSRREDERYTSRYPESPSCSNFQDNYEALSRRISDLKSERVRLSTFLTWDYGHVQDPRALAQWGLFYMGPGDKVQCAFCHGVLKRWEKTDIPYNEHAKYFPRCRFILGYDVGNIPIESYTVYNGLAENNLTYNYGIVTNGVNSQIPQSNTVSTPVYNVSPVTQGISPVGDFQEFYKHQENRLSSFSSWPPDKIQTPPVLSEAGFYHKPTPEKQDRVKCAYCAGKLFNWQVDDDPWIEHARCFPQCKYVQLCLGPEVVQDLLGEQDHHKKPNEFRHEEHVPLYSPPTTTSSNVTSLETQTTLSIPQTTPGDPVSARMTSEPVQAVLQMGYPEQMVKQTVERCVRERPDNFPPAEELASMLMELEDQLPVENAQPSAVSPLQRLIAAHGQGNDLAAKPVTSSSRSNVTNPMVSPLQRLIASRSSGSDVRRATDINSEEQTVASMRNGINEDQEKQKVIKDKLRNENFKLKDQFLCKICMENYVRVTFMPCGHLVCCVSCSMTVTECPICRAPISGYVRTYF